MKEGERKILLISFIAQIIIISSVMGCRYLKTIDEKRETEKQNRKEAVMQQYGATANDNVVFLNFEPGTHYVMETFVEDENSNINAFIENIPEGYELFDHSFQIDGNKCYHKFIYVNNKEVVAEGVYNEKNNEVIFSTPGTIVESQELTLKRGN